MSNNLPIDSGGVTEVRVSPAALARLNLALSLEAAEIKRVYGFDHTATANTGLLNLLLDEAVLRRARQALSRTRKLATLPSKDAP